MPLQSKQYLVVQVRFLIVFLNPTKLHIIFLIYRFHCITSFTSWKQKPIHSQPTGYTNLNNCTGVHEKQVLSNQYCHFFIEWTIY
jgi:hypothetical protein